MKIDDDIIYTKPNKERKKVVQKAKQERILNKEGKLPKKLDIKRRNPYDLRSKK